jgi:hypothetical protein
MSDDGLKYSISTLKQMSQCSARVYFRREVRAGRIPESEVLPVTYLVTGSAAHKGIEMALKEDRDPKREAALYVQENLLDKFDNLDKKEITDRLESMNRALDTYINVFHDSLRKTITDPLNQVEVPLSMPYRQGTFVGVVDLIPPNGVFVDWKTGQAPNPKKLEYLYRDSQSVVYFRMAEYNKMPTPKQFNYVYLQGAPTNFETKTYKTGEKAGQTYTAVVKDDPKPIYTFPVLQDEDKVQRIFNDFVDPLARQYEQEIFYKVETEYNCKSCAYRNICKATSIPAKDSI